MGLRDCNPRAPEEIGQVADAQSDDARSLTVSTWATTLEVQEPAMS